eukprot:COSAG01_NODE_551_length_15579_cov_30.915181_3_plen_47_part_00
MLQPLDLLDNPSFYQGTLRAGCIRAIMFSSLYHYDHIVQEQTDAIF